MLIHCSKKAIAFLTSLVSDPVLLHLSLNTEEGVTDSDSKDAPSWIWTSAR